MGLVPGLIHEAPRARPPACHCKHPAKRAISSCLKFGFRMVATYVKLLAACGRALLAIAPLSGVWFCFPITSTVCCFSDEKKARKTKQNKKNGFIHRNRFNSAALCLCMDFAARLGDSSSAAVPVLCRDSTTISIRISEDCGITMGRDHVKVCVRTRPTSTFAQDAIVIDKEAQVRVKPQSIGRVCPPPDTRYQYATTPSALFVRYVGSDISGAVKVSRCCLCVMMHVFPRCTF